MQTNHQSVGQRGKGQKNKGWGTECDGANAKGSSGHESHPSLATGTNKKDSGMRVCMHAAALSWRRFSDERMRRTAGVTSR